MFLVTKKHSLSFSDNDQPDHGLPQTACFAQLCKSLTFAFIPFLDLSKLCQLSEDTALILLVWAQCFIL